MAHIRGTDEHGPVYFMGCDRPGCDEVHNPALVSRKASDARQQARGRTHRADLTRKNGHLQALAATELTRHDQGHGLYDHETTTAPTHGGHTP